MKKMGFIFVAMFGFVSFAQALDLQALQAAFERANVNAQVEHAQKNVPPTRFADPQKQEAFNYYLVEGVEIIQKICDSEGLSKSLSERYVVLFLQEFVGSFFEYKNYFDRHYQRNRRCVTKDEYRAVNYAIFTLMMNGDEKERFASYRPHLGYTKEWLEENPVENWSEYVVACEKAMNYFYSVMRVVVELDREYKMQELKRSLGFLEEEPDPELDLL